MKVTRRATIGLKGLTNLRRCFTKERVADYMTTGLSVYIEGVNTTDSYLEIKLSVYSEASLYLEKLNDILSVWKLVRQNKGIIDLSLLINEEPLPDRAPYIRAQISVKFQ